ncbi:Protein kinase alk2 [Allomyces arbusculus]|nr:Protein kinase alk2 [Allomyces arbusculus]
MAASISRLAALANWLRIYLARTGRGTRVAMALAGAVAALAAILAAETARKRPKYRGAVEAPERSWIVGHGIMFLTTHETRNDWAFYLARYHLDLGQGHTSHLTAPFAPPLIFTTSPANVEHVLKTKFDNYVKGPVFADHQTQLLGHGIFNTDGDAWRAQRKTSSMIFSVRNFRDHMLHVFSRHARVLVDKLDTVAVRGTVVDLHDWFHRFTLDAFMEIGFGTPVDSLQADAPLPFATAFDQAQSITSKRMIMGPAQRRILEWWNGDAKQLQQCIKVTDDFAYRLIAQRRADPNAGNAQDLLARFLAMKKPGSSQGFSDEELRDVVINFIIAGRDTTAQALSWAIFELAQHPKVVAAMREEIARVVPTAFDSTTDDGENLDYDAVTRDLVYVRAVFSEALRLHPSVPQEIKFAIHADTLPDGTRVRAGDGIIWSPYAMGRLTELWGDDALEFKPERWIGENVPQPGPYKYPVFNAGPRTCLGQQMAYLEGVACLVKLLSKFEFEVVNPNEVTYRTALTLLMKNGLKVRVRRYVPPAPVAA